MSIIQKENCFCGYVEAGDRTYIYTVFKNENTQSNWKYEFDWRLNVLLGRDLDNFIKDLKFQSPLDFHNQINNFIQKQMISRNINTCNIQNPLKLCSHLKNLKEELENCEQYIKNLNIDTGVVEIEAVDSQFRSHKAVFKLGQNYPREAIEIITHFLPLNGIALTEDNSGLNNINSISEFCSKFVQLVNLFQDFWNLMSVLDSQSIVLDPPNPTFKDTYRRIKLTDTLSVALKFNSYSPNQRPNIKLLGCLSDVMKYEAILQKNLENEIWDEEEDVLYNLGNLLEISVPTKNNLYKSEEVADNADNAAECAICFMSRLEEEMPVEVCEKPSCKSMYHSQCLFTYLSSLPKNRDYFGKIQGECPNCDDVIFCTVPKFK